MTQLGDAFVRRMGLLPDKQTCVLRVLRECRGRLFPPPISKETAT